MASSLLSAWRHNTDSQNQRKRDYLDLQRLQIRSGRMKLKDEGKRLLICPFKVTFCVFELLICSLKLFNFLPPRSLNGESVSGREKQLCYVRVLQKRAGNGLVIRGQMIQNKLCIRRQIKSSRAQISGHRLSKIVSQTLKLLFVRWDGDTEQSPRRTQMIHVGPKLSIYFAKLQDNN